jgi:hypothetical protein
MYQPVYMRSYTHIDPSFLDDLQNFIDYEVEIENVDVAFVDAVLCIRGDLVQALFDRVPIIFAHDIAPLEIRLFNDVYEYGRVCVPDNYQEIYLPFGIGTAVWVKKETPYLELITHFESYVQSRQANPELF